MKSASKAASRVPWRMASAPSTSPPSPSTALAASARTCFAVAKSPASSASSPLIRPISTTRGRSSIRRWRSRDATVPATTTATARKISGFLCRLAHSANPRGSSTAIIPGGTGSGSGRPLSGLGAVSRPFTFVRRGAPSARLSGASGTSPRGASAGVPPDSSASSTHSISVSGSATAGAGDGRGRVAACSARAKAASTAEGGSSRTSSSTAAGSSRRRVPAAPDFGRDAGSGSGLRGRMKIP